MTTNPTRMMKPGSTLRIANLDADATVAIIVDVFSGFGFKCTTAPGVWPVKLSHGSDVLSFLMDPGLSAISLARCLPSVRRATDVMRGQIQVLEQGPRSCTLRVDLLRSEGAFTRPVGRFFETLHAAVTTLHERGVMVEAEPITDSARERHERRRRKRGSRGQPQE